MHPWLLLVINSSKNSLFLRERTAIIGTFTYRGVRGDPSTFIDMLHCQPRENKMVLERHISIR